MRLHDPCGSQGKRAYTLKSIFSYCKSVAKQLKFIRRSRIKNRPVQGGNLIEVCVWLTSCILKRNFIMTQKEEIRKKVIARMDVIRLYLKRMRQTSITVFTRLYNGGDIDRQLLNETGPIDAEDLKRWISICMEVGNDSLHETKEESDDEVMTCANKAEIESLHKKIAGDSYYIDSLLRFIGALEGKCGYQQEIIQEQKEQLQNLIDLRNQK